MNYLVPVDAILDRDSDAYDEAITLDRVLQVIEPAKQSAPRDPRCVPRQSVRAHHEAHRRLARAGTRPCGCRAGQAEHVDRVCREGRLDRRRRRRRQQPVHHGAAEAPDDAGSRPAQGVRPDPRRRHQGDGQQAGAVRLRLARRLRRVARAGCACCAERRRRNPRRARRPRSVATTNWRCSSTTGRRGNSSFSSIPPGSTPISRACSSTRSPPKRASARPPTRRNRPKPRRRASRPKARRSPNRPRPRARRRPPRRRVLQRRSSGRPSKRKPMQPSAHASRPSALPRRSLTKEKAEAEAKAIREKAQAEAKVIRDKAEADAKAAEEARKAAEKEAERLRLAALEQAKTATTSPALRNRRRSRRFPPMQARRR